MSEKCEHPAWSEQRNSAWRCLFCGYETAINPKRAIEVAAELQSRLTVAEDALQRHGYRKSCDIPACNCGDQWTHGGHAAERLRELADVLYENGKTPLEVAKELVSKLDAFRDAIRAADRAIEACEGVSLVSYLNRGGAEHAVETVMEALSDE